MKSSYLTLLISIILISVGMSVKAQKPTDYINTLHHRPTLDISYKSNENQASSSSKQLIDELLKEASTHIGKRYRAGGKGPNQFDCSGFSSYVFRKFGINLNPSSSTQYQQGEKVSRDELRKGDLVFFTRRSSGNTVGHVGIVTNVDKDNGTFKFIHASNTGITISEYEGYYKNTYVGARRIIQ